MGIYTKPRFGAIAVTCGAFLFIAASAALGFTYGYLVGQHYHWLLGVVFAGAALGGEIMKPFAVQAAFANWYRPLRLVACAAVALVCIGYSLASELGLAAMSRGDLAAERQAETDMAVDDADRKKRALEELATLKAARPVAELEALIKRSPVKPTPAPKSASECMVENGTGRWVCRAGPGGRAAPAAAPAVHPLAAELARAKRRAELEGVANGTSIGRKVDADPLATSLATYAALAGYAIKVETLSKVLNLVPVLFLEVGSSFGLVVVNAMRPRLPAPANDTGHVSRWQRLRARWSRKPAATVAPPAIEVGEAVSIAHKDHEQPTPAEVAKRRRMVAEFETAYEKKHGQRPRHRDVMKATGLPRATVTRYRARAVG